jgi:hypothetical protein
VIDKVLMGDGLPAAWARNPMAFGRTAGASRTLNGNSSIILRLCAQA